MYLFPLFYIGMDGQNLALNGRYVGDIRECAQITSQDEISTKAQHPIVSATVHRLQGMLH